MRNVFTIAFTALFILITGSTSIVAQNEDSGSLNSGTIESQYDYMWDSSNRYQDHRVIKNSKLDKFKSNVLDSLKELHVTINSLEKTISSQDILAAQKKSQIDSLTVSLATAVGEKENFSIMGTEMSKSSFKSLFWLITSVLAFLTIFFFMRMQSKMSTAKEAKSNFSMLEGEFEDYKKKSREKEQVLARQLQDEINKNI